MYHYRALCIALMLFFPVHPVAAADVEININEENCNRVQKHVAQDDVTYKPGIDVHGKPVVPADVTSNQLKMPENIIIDLSIPLQDLFKDKQPGSDALKNAEVQIGILEYNLLSGKLKFNGQELSDPALHAIAVECRKIYADTGS